MKNNNNNNNESTKSAEPSQIISADRSVIVVYKFYTGTENNLVMHCKVDQLPSFQQDYMQQERMIEI